MSTRRKGERTARHIDREFPHQVEVKIPEGGLGMRLNAMHDWAKLRAGEDYRTRSVRGTGGGDQAMRWCFRSPDLAAVFAAEWEGVRCP